MPVRILLIEDNPGDAVIFREKIDASPLDTTLVHVVRLKDALERLRADAFDLVFVDLSLPDAQGLETVDRVRAAAPHLPLIVLTGLDDATAAAEAKKRGAVDYLVKWYVDSASLARYVRYAIEQYRLLGHEGATAPASRRAAQPAPPAPARPVAVEGDAAAAEAPAGPSGDGAQDARVAPPVEARAPAPPAAAEEALLVPALEAALTVAQGAAMRADHLAGSLRAALDLARIADGSPAPEPVDVLPLVQQAVDRARARALHAGIPVRLRSERKRVFAAADRQALGQALERLVALALGTGCGSGVHFGASCDGPRATLRVVWELESGVRLEPTEDPLLGLDLSLCRRLAARAGGAVTLLEDGREAAIELTFQAPAHG